ncbi:hypothetical protein HDU97_002907 [Phlyctochytrium planicorne]|nr:hypothetical protein HDU97_002907 [Phlyctochytrium planicorne]
MVLRALAVGGAVLATAVGLAYWKVVPDDTKELGSLRDVDPEIRKDYPEDFWETHAYANLSQGKTHYSLLGPDTGPKLVLVHGIVSGFGAVPKFVDNLVSKGYRVLVYDLLGRGYSDTPPGSYDFSFYAQQLNDLLVHVGWSKANVLGYSLGGGIATGFAATYPEKVDRLILIAPAGMPDHLPALGIIVNIPILGNLFAHGLGRRIMKNTSDEEFKQHPELEQTAAIAGMYLMHHPGIMSAIAQTVRNGPIRHMSAYYEKNGRHFKNRILCIWGTADDVVSFKKDMPKFKMFNPEAKIVELPNVDHALVPTHPIEISEHVHEFLKT